MTRKLLTEFNTSPYFDDFNENKNFLRVLFKPGVAVQTRELNQLQSILTDQISKFGNHIFKDGSPVLGGSFNVDVNVSYIKIHEFDSLSNSTVNLSVSSYIDQLEDRVLVSTNPDGSVGVKFKVRKVAASNSLEPNTLVGVYLSGGIVAESEMVLTTLPEENKENYQVTVAKPDTTLKVSAGDNITGASSLASVDDGIFYVSGFFHKVLKQTIILDKYQNNPSYRIGLEVDETTISSGDDQSLYDNAQGSPNFSAPGSDRFKISLILKKQDLLENQGNTILNNSSYEFYEFVRVRNGQKVDQIKNPRYSHLGEELARRTYDTNGDFVVKNFVLDIEEYTSDEISNDQTLDDKLKLTLDPGKAYVKGFEIETISPQKISMDKGRDTDSSIPDQNIDGFVGNSLYVKFRNDITKSSLDELFSNNFLELNLYNNNNPADLIGTCRLKQFNNDIQSDSDVYKLSIFNLVMGENYSEQSIESIGTSTQIFFDVDALSKNSAGETFINYQESSSLIFPLRESSVKSVNTLKGNFSNVLEMSSDTTSNIPNKVSYKKSVEGLTITDTASIPNLKSHFVFYDSEGLVDIDDVNNISVRIDAETNTVFLDYADTLANATTRSPKLYLRQQNDNLTFRTKTKTSISKTLNHTAGEITSSLIKEVILNHVDIFKIDKIYINGDDTKTITQKYRLDNGQRDSFYDFGKIIWDEQQDPVFNDNNQKMVVLGEDVDSITIEYDYFERGSDGEYFSVNSYVNIDYSEIPVYNSDTGKSYMLTDYLDFRPSRQPDDGFGTSSVPYGQGDDFFEVTYEYYLSRIDKVCLTKDKEFRVIKGSPSKFPITPPDDQDSMSLYIVTVPPYTYDDNDVKVIPIHNRRYTMRDIGILDRRIEELQSRSNLRLLQEKSKNVQIRNVAGTEEVFKNGVLIDDFSGHNIGNVNSKDYNCSIDFETQELRPSFSSNSHDIEYSPQASDGVLKKGPLVISEYDEVEHKIYGLSSGSINLNPPASTYWFGEVKLNPSSDMWFSQSLTPRVNVNSFGENNAWQLDKGFGSQWNDWETLWTGKESLISDEEVNLDITRTSNPVSLQSEETQNYLFDVVDRIGVVGTGLANRIEKTMKNKKVDNSVVPFMRSDDILFVAVNLEPNQSFYPFIDDTPLFNQDQNTSHVTKCKLIKLQDSSLKFKDGIYDGEVLTFGNDSSELKVVLNLNDGTGRFYVKEISGTISQGSTVTGKDVSGINQSSNIESIEESSGISLTSDQFGNLCGTINLPSTESEKFKTGERLFRLIDNPNNQLVDSDGNTITKSLCETFYSSLGIMEDPEDFISSTRTPMKRRSNICDNLSVSRDPVMREVQSLSRCLDWRDPLSQVFTVDLAENRNGIFLSSVDLFFKSKDDTLPVSIDVRPTSNGFPSTSTIIPFSEVTKSSSDVVISSGPDPEVSSNTHTKFTFDSPIYLRPGNYAITVKTNSGNYELWRASIGETVLNSDGTVDINNTKITGQPLLGGLYASQNAGNLQELNNQFLMFRLNKCQFHTGSKNILFKSQTSSTEKVNLFKFNASFLKNFTNTDNPSFRYTFSDSSSLDSNLYKKFNENRNFDLSSEVNFSNFTSHCSFTITDPDVSPVFDLERMSLITVKNNIAGENDDKVCYISKKVNLKYPYNSKDIRVYLDLYKPSQTSIKVYYKVGNTSSQDSFDSSNWIELDQLTPSHIYSEYYNDYREFVFGTSGAGVDLTGLNSNTFNMYAIKIEMQSPLSSIVPKARNLRALALQEPAGV